MTKSAISAGVSLSNALPLGTDREVHMNMKGLFNCRPPVVLQQVMWDPKHVWILLKQQENMELSS